MHRNSAHINDGTAGFDDAWHDWKGWNNMLEGNKFRRSEGLYTEQVDLHRYRFANSKAKNKSLLNRSGCNRFVSSFCRFTNKVGR